jgi:uncharacterized protein (DUF2236 family)
MSAALRLLPALSAPVRMALRNWVVSVFQKGGGPVVDYDHPPGDPGLFGPDSVTWKIHADFPGMMAGGIAALMLQTLHPLALAGVWDHSSFRTDILGRLRRTTAFVAATSFAPTAEAEKMIAKVRAIHTQVKGRLPDGRRYSANSPRLLTWVHCTEMWSFLAGYRMYRSELPLAIQDRYYAETAQLAEALGAKKVPKSVAEIEAYFESVQGDLEFSDRSVDVLAVLAGIELPIPASAVARELFLGSGAALLPPWAQRRMGRGRVQQLRDRAAARGLKAMGPLFRAALKEGVGAHSCRRVGVSAQAMQFGEDFKLARVAPAPRTRKPRHSREAPASA